MNVNINAQTFHGCRIRVTYKCGHVETELSMSDAETRERRRITKSIDCHCCILIARQPVNLKPIADPVSLQLAARRKETMTRLEQRFGQLRTH